MTHARTIARYACLAGLVAGLLAPVQSLAQGFESGAPYHSANTRASIAAAYGVRTSRESGTAMIATNYRARHSNLPGAVTRYTSGTVMVPASTYRTAALSALGRGVMHPGFQLAIAAAGFAYSQLAGIQVPDYESIPPNTGSIEDIPGNYSYSVTNNDNLERHNTAFSACSSIAIRENNNQGANNTAHLQSYRITSGFGTIRAVCTISYSAFNGGTNDLTATRSNNQPTHFDTNPPPQLVTATESDLEQLDDHLPESIVDDLWSDSEASQEWEQIISDFWSSTPGTSNVDAQGQAAPELYPRVRQDNENLYADLAGKPRPNPDTQTEGRTASEQMYEETQEIPPDFPGVEPEWQVEEIDSLPDYNMGIGAGSCPAPSSISLPSPLSGSVTLEWQPFCDLAGMIRGAFIAVAMILSLYIVLRK